MIIFYSISYAMFSALSPLPTPLLLPLFIWLASNLVLKSLKPTKLWLLIWLLIFLKELFLEAVYMFSAV